MRIQLFHAPTHHYAGSYYRLNPGLGLPIIAAVLEQAGHQVEVWDLEALRISPASLGQGFAAQHDRWPDAVGVHCSSYNARGVRETLKALRDAGFEDHIVIGGPHVTIPGNAEQVLAWGADCVVVGECEGNVEQVFAEQQIGVVQGLPLPIDDVPGPLWEKHLPRLVTYLGNQPKVGHPEGISMWSRGCPGRCIMCVVGDTRIETMSGSSAMADIKVGDEVLTAEGVTVVKDKQILLVDEDLVEINVQGMFSNLHVTPDHEILAVHHKRLHQMASAANVVHRPQWIQQEVPAFVRADGLKVGDYLVAPYPIEVKPNAYSADDFELFGLYIAEGCVAKQSKRPGYYNLSLDFSAQQGALAERALGLLRRLLHTEKGSLYLNKSNNVLRACIGGHDEILWFERTFGKGAKRKKIPAWAMLASRTQQIALLRGLFWGDGHNAQKSIRYDTVSRILAEQIRLILLRMGGVPNIFQIPAHKRPERIQGRVVNRVDAYIVTLFGPATDELRREFGWAIRNVGANRRYNRAHNVNGKGYALYPIRAIGRIPHAGAVYDLTTNGTFVANGIAISNCANPVFGGRKTRYRPPGAIREDMQTLRDLGARSVFVYDDQLVTGNGRQGDWLRQVCEGVAPLHMTWKCQGRCSEKLDLGTLKAMRAAGCRAIMWGIESFSNGVLENLRKDTTEADIWHSLRLAKEAGIGNWAFLMVGNYGETATDLAYTEKRLARAQREGLVQWRQVTVCTPYPGSKLWGMAKAEGWLVEPPEAGPQMGQAYAPTPWLTQKQIAFWRRQLEMA